MDSALINDQSITINQPIPRMSINGGLPQKDKREATIKNIAPAVPNNIEYEVKKFKTILYYYKNCK